MSRVYKPEVATFNLNHKLRNHILSAIPLNIEKTGLIFNRFYDIAKINNASYDTNTKKLTFSLNNNIITGITNIDATTIEITTLTNHLLSDDINNNVLIADNTDPQYNTQYSTLAVISNTVVRLKRLDNIPFVNSPTVSGSITTNIDILNNQASIINVEYTNLITSMTLPELSFRGQDPNLYVKITVQATNYTYFSHSNQDRVPFIISGCSDNQLNGEYEVIDIDIGNDILTILSYFSVSNNVFTIPITKRFQIKIFANQTFNQLFLQNDFTQTTNNIEISVENDIDLKGWSINFENARLLYNFTFFFFFVESEAKTQISNLISNKNRVSNKSLLCLEFSNTSFTTSNNQGRNNPAQDITNTVQSSSMSGNHKLETLAYDLTLTNFNSKDKSYLDEYWGDRILKTKVFIFEKSLTKYEPFLYAITPLAIHNSPELEVQSTFIKSVYHLSAILRVQDQHFSIITDEIIQKITQINVISKIESDIREDIYTF